MRYEEFVRLRRRSSGVVTVEVRWWWRRLPRRVRAALYGPAVRREMRRGS